MDGYRDTALVRPATYRISGPLITDEHSAQLYDLTADCDPNDPLVLDVSSVTTLSEIGFRALRSVAAIHIAPVSIVCNDVMLRCELELTDLDLVADVQSADWMLISQPQQAA